MKKKKLQGKVAVVTGASRGIGYAIAKMFASEGAVVYDISRTVVAHDEMKKSYSCNVNDYDKIAEILDEIKGKEGKIDIFVNNAGFGIAGLVEHSLKENIYKQVDTNLSAVMALSSLAVKYLKESKGKLINVSSVGGVMPLPYQASYSATKAGVEIFSRALANEVKDYGVKVVCILPGDTKTGFTSARVIDNKFNDEQQRKDVEKSLAKIAKDEEEKGMSPDKVAMVAVKVAKKKNPPLRVTVGVGYKTLVFLQRIVSTKFLNFIIRKLYCKKDK